MISKETYKSISDIIALFVSSGSGLFYNFNNLLSFLDNSTLNGDSVIVEKMRAMIISAQTDIDYHYNDYKNLYALVVGMQKHVTSNYSSLNLFLSDNEILVSPIFAEISEKLGYSIDIENIEGS